jgi:hypothetical protein
MTSSLIRTTVQGLLLPLLQARFGLVLLTAWLAGSRPGGRVGGFKTEVQHSL